MQKLKKRKRMKIKRKNVFTSVMVNTVNWCNDPTALELSQGVALLVPLNPQGS